MKKHKITCFYYRKYYDTKMRRILIIVLSILIVSMCGCSSSNQSEVSYENSCPSNNIVTSLITDLVDVNSIYENDRYIYYLTPSGIWQYEKSAATKKVIIANDKIVSFVLDGNRLYYCVDNALLYDYEYGKDSFIAIYDMSDKSSRTVLEYSAVESRMVNSNLRDFFVNNDVLYIYSSGTSLIYYDIATGNIGNFVDDLSSGALYNGNFYYIDHAEKTLSVYVRNGDGSQVLYDDDHSYSDVFTAFGNMYFISQSPAELYLMSESRNKKLCNLGLSGVYMRYYVSDDYIYIWMNEILYKYDPITDSCSMVTELKDLHDARPFKIIDGYLIYYSSDIPSELSVKVL